MYVKNVDGVPVFATHLIECDIEKIKINRKIPFQIEQEGLISYSKDETGKIIKYLKKNEIEYKITPLNNAKQSTIDESIKYQNRTEIIEHLQNGKKPKHKKDTDLEKRVEVLEKQVKVLMDKLNMRY